MTVALRRLTPADLEQLLPLDQKLFPPIFHMAEGLLASQLIAAELKGRNHSVGAFDSGKLVGYMIIICRPSELDPREWVCSMVTMAVERAYRREAVEPMIAWAMRMGLLSGYLIEGNLRETTSYRMILRTRKMIGRFGYRIVAVTPRAPVGKERMILLRFEHTFSRDPVLRPWYFAATRLYSAGYAAFAIPRRVLRRVCDLVPYQRVPRWLRRLTFMELDLESGVPAKP